MSFPSHDGGDSFSGILKPKPQKSRSVRWQGSPQGPCLTPPSRIPPPSASSLTTSHANSYIGSPQLTMTLPTTSSLSAVRGAVLYSPSIFYRFPVSCEPAFVSDVTVPNHALPFTTQPPSNLLCPMNARFLVYAISSAPVSTAPIKFILNNHTISHWVTDPRAIDVTDYLSPFGTQNWLILDTFNFIAPFSVVGVWADCFTFDDILKEIGDRGKFVFSELAAVCPISQSQVCIPARGAYCHHNECFDLGPYISYCQAIGQWTCPFCQSQVTFDQLRIGERPGYQSFPSLDDGPSPQYDQIEPYDQTSWAGQSADFDQGQSSFWD